MFRVRRDIQQFSPAALTEIMENIQKCPTEISNDGRTVEAQQRSKDKSSAHPYCVLPGKTLSGLTTGCRNYSKHLLAITEPCQIKIFSGSISCPLPD